MALQQFEALDKVCVLTCTVLSAPADSCATFFAVVSACKPAAEPVTYRKSRCCCSAAEEKLKEQEQKSFPHVLVSAIAVRTWLRNSRWQEDFQGQHDYALGRTFIQWPLANFGKAAVVVITKAAESERLVDLVDSKSSRSWLWFKEVKVLSLKMSSSQQLFLSRSSHAALLLFNVFLVHRYHGLKCTDSHQ